MSAQKLLRSTSQTVRGAWRDLYSNEVEPRPSRFSSRGRDYAAWAHRADAWATQHSSIPEEES